MNSPFSYPNSFDEIPVWNPDGEVFEDAVQDHSLREDFEERAERLVRKPFVGVQSVSIVPLKKGPWTANNQLGIQQEFAADSNNRQTVLKLDEWGFPEAWSIMLGIEYDFSDSSDGNFWAITAHLLLGVGGALQEVDVDWVEGTTIRASINALNVIASYDTAGFPAAVVIPDDLKLRVTLAQGNVGTRPPTKTERISTITTGDANGVNVKVPKFAKRLYIMSSNDPANTYNAANTILFRTSQPAALGATLARLDGDQLLSFPEGIPIPNGCRYINFVNNSGVDIDFLMMIFELAL